MSFLARKVTLSKWVKIENEISADAITSCLRTSKNELSFWVIEDENDDLLREVALVLGSGGERVEKVEIVLINSQTLIDKGFEIVENPGVSKVDDLNKKHRDIINLNLPKLGTLSEEIMSEIGKSSELDEEEFAKYFKVKLFTKKEVEDIIVSAIVSKRLKFESLHEIMQGKLKSKVEAATTV